jgi:hypothetical protein
MYKIRAKSLDILGITIYFLKIQNYFKCLKILYFLEKS